jgi:hypothetical protein
MRKSDFFTTFSFKSFSEVPAVRSTVLSVILALCTMGAWISPVADNCTVSGEFVIVTVAAAVVTVTSCLLVPVVGVNVPPVTVSSTGALAGAWLGVIFGAVMDSEAFVEPERATVPPLTVRDAVALSTFLLRVTDGPEIVTGLFVLPERLTVPDTVPWSVIDTIGVPVKVTVKV